MKRLTSVIFFIYFSTMYCQEAKRIGEVKIEKTVYTYQVDSLDISNKKRKIWFDEFYFNEKGDENKMISYGRRGAKNLKEIGQLEQFTYENDKLIKSESWDFGCEICKQTYYFTEYKYDKNDSLVNETRYKSNRDNPFWTTNYIRSKNKKETHFKEYSYYNVRYYDEFGKTIKSERIENSTNAIDKSWKYEYVGNCKIEKSKNEEGNYIAVMEICYDPKKRLQKKEFLGKYKKLYNYYYNHKGYLKEIIISEKYDSENQYKKVRSIKFKLINRGKRVSEDSINKINSTLIEDVVI